ncbi:cationic amino acid transporter 4-like isoform X2 [Biomphalaria glabrata]|nr:cationic amino acid transporter 4-like isoform X2 [Biomphalaria glabrata]KAI8731814.1 cationic amino acid transporter 4-like [Biomphalaria glabrata]
MDFIKRQLSRITRVKTIPEDLHETSLRRCLNTFDITLLGIGHMIGAGIYVLTGTVVREKAGPSAVLSFLFAGTAALLSALCYAEFGARIPKAGSAYSYTYVTIGEIWGFLIGWNIILEHMIGAASVARAWSGAMDAIFNQAIRNGTIEHIGRLSQDNEWISEYPDMVAMGITLIAFLIIGFGAKISVNFNSVFTILNALVLAFIIIIGFTFADPSLWSSSSGHGGFFPFGFSGTLSGAATCFFAYIGFEGIAIASEEARDPEKSIPRATVLSLLTVTTLYLLVTAALTLMIPYYETNTSAAFPFAFDEVGAHWAKYIVAVGTLLGISTSLLGSAFSLPRSVYAMAEDGLLFGFFSFVHSKTQTPIYAVIVFGALSALMALLFEITTLVEFMSIGTLFGYTIVAASIIILRYQPVSKCQFKLRAEETQTEAAEPVDTSVVNVSETTPLSKSDPSTPVKTDKSGLLPKSKSHDDFGRLRQNLREVPILRRFEPGDGVKSAVVLMGLFMVGLMLVVIEGAEYLRTATWWAVLLVIVFSLLIVIFYLVIVAHEKNDAFLTFQIPFVPLIPALSMLINIALMLSLTYLTWLRLVIWITVGLLLYFVYGIHYSRENKKIQGYGPMVEYKGDAALPESTMSGMTEEVKELQPPRKDEGLYQQ